MPVQSCLLLVWDAHTVQYHLSNLCCNMVDSNRPVTGMILSPVQPHIDWSIDMYIWRPARIQMHICIRHTYFVVLQLSSLFVSGKPDMLYKQCTLA